jgi:hypothetical protein
MLTPMQVQYLVALCCRKREPDAIDIIVGDMVQDSAAEKERDVDVTVTIREDDGSLTAFMAYEVKREGERLDVISVEGLCAKLNDMPLVTHRAIVSTSGYTDGAISKAKAHKVGLYILKPWTRPVSEQFPEFPNVGLPAEFLANFHSTLLYWEGYSFYFVCPAGPPFFVTTNETRIVAKDGSPHEHFRTLEEYQKALLLRSTEILYLLQPAQALATSFPNSTTVGQDTYATSPACAHTHTLDIREDQVFLKIDSDPVQAVTTNISGSLQWRRRKRTPEFYIMESVQSGDIFAAAAVADFGAGDGRMFVMVFPPDSRELDFHIVQLLEKHKNAIRKLKVPPTKRAQKSP